MTLVPVDVAVSIACVSVPVVVADDTDIDEPLETDHATLLTVARLILFDGVDVEILHSLPPSANGERPGMTMVTPIRSSWI